MGEGVAARAGLVYLALPLDLIPDFVPVVGYLDDLLLVMLLVAWLLLRALPDDVVEEQVGALEGEMRRPDSR